LTAPSSVIARSPQGDEAISKGTINDTHSIGSQVIRQIILPELEKEVNEGKNFATLRQMYSGMVLATWYKRALKESLLGKVYADRAKVKGVDQNPKNNQAIYNRYLRAFKKGVFNYIKDDVDKYTNQEIPRKYFSGGYERNLILNRESPDYMTAAEVRVLKSGDALPAMTVPAATFNVHHLNKLTVRLQQAVRPQGFAQQLAAFGRNNPIADVRMAMAILIYPGKPQILDYNIPRSIPDQDTFHFVDDLAAHLRTLLQASGYSIAVISSGRYLTLRVTKLDRAMTLKSEEVAQEFRKVGIINQLTEMAPEEMKKNVSHFGPKVRDLADLLSKRKFVTYDELKGILELEGLEGLIGESFKEGQWGSLDIDGQVKIIQEKTLVSQRN